MLYGCSSVQPCGQCTYVHPPQPSTSHSALPPRRWRLLKAHGTAVGLPSDADMGNSEVGHNALGAGEPDD